MNLYVFVTLMIALQLIYWIVGKRASKQLEGNEDYFLAGRSVAFFPLMMTFLATQVGGGVILGAADEAYRFGWPVIFYPLGAALGLILLGVGVGRRLALFKVSTVAQILELVYGSKRLKQIASLLSIISLLMILAAQIVASARFLSSLGLDQSLLFILFWVSVILYTVQGGLRAVIATDLIQAAVFTLVFVFCFAWTYTSGLQQGNLPTFEVGLASGVSSKLTGWLLMPLLFMVIEQDMGQRCFAGSSPKVVTRAAFVAGLVTMAVCIVPVFLGSWAKSLGLLIPEGASVLMVTVASLTNPLVTACIGCAVLAAIISTATSLINAISSNLSNDFLIRETKTSSQSIRAVRTITAVVSLTALGLSFYFDRIVELLIISYELSVSCLFVPICVALWNKGASRQAAWASILCGAVGFILFRLYPMSIPREIGSLILSALGFALVELLHVYRRKKQMA